MFIHLPILSFRFNLLEEQMALSTRTQLFKEGRRYPMDKSLSSR